MNKVEIQSQATPEIRQKLADLEVLLKSSGSILVAYSGGVDSTFLAYIAHRVLGEKALAVTAQSESIAPEEFEEAKRIAAAFKIAHKIVKTEELNDPHYSANPLNRCYFCKKELMEKLQGVARTLGYEKIALGAIVDDLSDLRPGENAAQEGGAVFPLRDVGLTKAEIRVLSAEFGLPTANKPGGACLASRIPFQQKVTADKLSRVAQSEALLHRLGFENCRVRHHDTIARIEVPPDRLADLVQRRDEITECFKELGFIYVTLDLQGLRSGSLHEAVEQKS